MATSFAKLRIVHIVNRTTEPLNIIYDGVPKVIPPGYRLEPALDAEGQPRMMTDEHGVQTPILKPVPTGVNGQPHAEPIEYYMAERAKSQHPIPGTLDPYSHLDYEMYLGVVEWGDDVSYAPPSAAVELIDRSLLPASRQHVEAVHIAGARKDSKQRSRRRRLYIDMADAAIPNPNGIKGDYEGGADFSR